ncbi:protein-disulfide reductase DsbD family protein [Fodinibius halophilus]|uniref:Thioredoxin fold domain-containing protein n=1 Tax=Fodinibius halophilus TaxID=1736908 RepID=A0A6M1T3G0_9BACT|nr:cytochrome c biogenesis protein CcdA [Fodinibius halophilus]NGP87755.1 thioredoxin fold domain-containing protein [Fodinibius halophilus]
MRNSIIKIMGIIVMVLSPFFVQGQMLDPVSYSVSDAPETVQAGEVFELTIKASIDGKWHLYSVANDPDAGPYPTQFTSANSKMAVAGEVTESEPVIEMDPNFNAELGWHTKEATFTIPVAFREDASGSVMVDLEVLYQVCDDKTCLPPKTKSITHSINISGTSDSPYQGFEEAEAADTKEESSIGTVPSAESDGSVSSSDNASTGLGSSGIFSFLWIALTAGFAALLTPCVFPMIPLTVSFFSKQKEGQGSGKAVWQAVGFGLTIVLTFTILGALLALILGASGANQFAANPWVNLFIAAILVVFAVSLLGAFELRLPHQLTNWLNRKSNESSGVIGILFMALTISAVSFSCTAPFVGGVLAATTGGEWFYPIIGMAGFSAAFASPFVVFALFPRWLESLPQSGSWMNIVKVLLGFIELAAAVKFLSNADLVWEWGLISRPFAIATWIAIFLLAGFYVLGMYAINHDSKPKQIGTGRLMLAMPFILFSFYLIPGLMGASLGIWDAWLPPKQATDVSVVRSFAQLGGGSANSSEAEMWSSNYKESREKAKQENKPVFIDFTGYTCTNCRAMETNVFPRESIKKRFAKMQLVRLYTDDGSEGPANQRFQFELTGTVALPTYVVLDPESETILQQLVGYADKEEFQQFLDAGLQQYGKRNSGFQTGIN